MNSQMNTQPPFVSQPQPPVPACNPASASTPAPAANRRPGAIRAVAVLGFVQAGFNVMGAFMSLQGAGQLADFGLRRTSVGSSLTILGLLGLASAALLIIGGLTVLRGKALVITVGASVSILLSVWWAIEFDYVRQLQMMALMMAALPIVTLGLLFGTAARAWVRFDLPSIPTTAGTRAAEAPATATPNTATPYTAVPNHAVPNTADPNTATPNHAVPDIDRTVVSNPARPAAKGSAPAGWEADPTGRHQVRYWDGAAWTVHVADNGVTGTDPL